MAGSGALRAGPGPFRRRRGGADRRPARRRQTWVPAAVLVVAVSAASCGRPLQHGHQSLEALASAVLEGLAANDPAAMRRLMLDETEFREQVWPELPASRPERKMPFSYVWTDLKTKSEAGLAGVLLEHGGRRYTLHEVRFAGATTKYDSFLVHRDSRVTVTDQHGGRHTLQLFGSVIQKGGRFKVFSYVVD